MKPSIRVFIGGLGVGGTERHLASILPALVARGWSIRVITLQYGGYFRPILERQGVRVESVLSTRHHDIFLKWPSILRKPIQLCLAILTLYREFKRDPKTPIHCFLPESYIVTMMVARWSGFSGCAFMSRRSLNEYYTQRPWFKWLECYLHPHMTCILGNSQAVVRQLCQEEKVSPEKVRLLYNGIDVTLFARAASRASTRAALGLADTECVFIIVANLIPYKGHRDLLEALGHLQKTGGLLHWRLLCVGRDDGIGEALQAYAASLQLMPHIVWLGARYDVADLYGCADIGILCSHQEGFSNAILEGMAAGLPMIVTDVGGNREAVIHDETGWVLPPKDIMALAQAIERLAHDPIRRARFGQKAQQRIRECFSLERCVQQYETLYQSCGV